MKQILSNSIETVANITTFISVSKRLGGMMNIYLINV
jgi:hypothetical protein